MTYRKKLIEVALPLDAINKASAREKSIRHGHPSTLHLWWARRPLAACRAVLFASLVDDPSEHPENFPSEQEQERERQQLFRLIEELVKWENSNNENVLQQARREILHSTGVNPPPVLDPFAGGGSIPLEAQRLGLEAHASDLNPVAVLINKALIEIPPRFAGCPPVNPQARRGTGQGGTWNGVAGLAEDVRYYGQWMRDEAQRRIGHLYPQVQLPQEYGGGQATVIAWLWARTVQCPNPACGARMPLVRSFALSTKAGKAAWVEPQVDRSTQPPTIRFAVQTGSGKPPESTVSRKGAICIACRTSVPLDHVRAEGRAGRMSAQLMAIVAEGQKGRSYLPPTYEQEMVAAQAKPQNVPETNLPEQALGFRVQLYGMTKHRDLFTPRQLVALTTFSELINEVRMLIQQDAIDTDLDSINYLMVENSSGYIGYGDMITIYLAFLLDKQADLGNALNRWEPVAQCPRQLFARQAISMVWDFAEGNPLGSSSGSWTVLLDNLMRSFQSPLMNHERLKPGIAKQSNAADIIQLRTHPLVSTDPPYYDNVPYADLSDFFYIWLRQSIGEIYPELFSTLLVPKAQELVADPFRHGSRTNAQHFFEEGLGKVFSAIRTIGHVDYPVTVFYAFKQTEADDDDDARETGVLVQTSTGWETMLEGLLKAGFQITGTWPIRTEMGSRMRGQVSNALASSIVLVCRPRPADAPLATRREFLTALKRELPGALKALQHGNVAPVDLAQASIGPGMAVFSRYSRVMEADGTPLRVRTALQLINQTLDEVLTEQEGEYDADMRWAVAWFDQYAHAEGPYGMAETLSKAKNTSVAGLEEAGVLVSKGGKVHLLPRTELPAAWNPRTDAR